MKTIWNTETGEARAYESVDAREMLKNSPDLYTDIDPNPPKKDKDGNVVDKDGNVINAGPQNVASVENEFRREPVGDDVPAPPREGVIIRNPVTDQPLMAPRAGSAEADAADAAVEKRSAADKSGEADLDSMTSAELKAYAAKRNIDLGDAIRKDDIRAAIDKAGKR